MAVVAERVRGWAGWCSRCAMSPSGRLRFVVAVMLLAAVGCSRGAQTRATGAPEVVFTTAQGTEVRVAVEVARTDAERERGLMFRQRLDPGRGMLFLFERPKRQVFWMRNTYLALDMIFLGADRRVLGVVENAEPLTEDGRSIEADSQFVVEVPGGWAAAQRIGPGTTARFVNVEAP